MTFDAWKQRARPSIRQPHMGGVEVLVDFAGDTTKSSIAVVEAFDKAKGDVGLFSSRRQPLGFPDRVEVDNSDVT
jgi:hypothetical protein